MFYFVVRERVSFNPVILYFIVNIFSYKIFFIFLTQNEVLNINFLSEYLVMCFQFGFIDSINCFIPGISFTEFHKSTRKCLVLGKSLSPVISSSYI